MAYVKNIWVDQDVERPKTYDVTTNQDGSITLVDSFGIVTELGTPVNATNMNHIENGIAGNDTAITTINSKIPSNASSSNKLVSNSDLNNKILPTQTSQAGKYLYTNGTTASWQALSGLDEANKDLSNLSTAGDDKLRALRGYLENGNLITDVNGLNYVKQYAHSSYDSTKFTKVGSPTITEDGIASGFTSSNYLTKAITINGAFRCKGRFRITNDVDNFKSVCSLLANNNAQLVAELRVKQTGSYLIYAQDSETRTSVTVNYNFTANTWYDYEMVYNGTTLDLLFNGVSVVTPVTPYFDTITGINIGVTYSAGLAFSIGDIDLKYIELSEYNIPIFNGNKTGLDVLKADNYTVVGSPTISSDGMASGFSSGNYITVPDSLKNATDYQVDFSFITIVSTTSAPYLFAEGNGNIKGFSIYMDTSGKLFVRVGSDTTSNQITTLVDGDLIDLSIIISGGTTGIVKWNKNGVAQTDVTLDMTGYSAFSADTLYIGRRSSGSYFKGFIDLNSIRFYVKGDLEYQPCLKIPYTESADKYGSKIVNSVYKNRVISAWNQNYLQRYYTLDEVNNNFTLPMGEVYGMMEKRANVDLSNITDTAKVLLSGIGMPSENYINLTLGVSESTYTAPADGWVMLTRTLKNGVLGVSIVYANSDGLSMSQWNGTSEARSLNVYIPISKNETFKVFYSGTFETGSADRFQFIYANGSGSEVA